MRLWMSNGMKSASLQYSVRMI